VVADHVHAAVRSLLSVSTASQGTG
jgi:hypothetical protein